MKLHGQLELLRIRDFRCYYSASLVSWLGDAMMVVALVFAVLQVSPSPAALGAVLGARTLTLLPMLLFGGVLGDRWSRRAIMITADLTRAVTQGVVAVLILTGEIEFWHFVVSQVIFGAGTALFNPASSGLLPTVVPHENLQSANALRGMGGSLATIAGPLLGGLMVAGVGPGWTLLADAATFGLSATFLLAMTRRSDGGILRTSMARDLVDGWSAFKARTWLWTLVIYSAIANMVFAAFTVLGPVDSATSSDGPRTWGIILASFGAGTAMGAVLGLHIHPRRPLRVAVAASALLTLPPTVMALGCATPIVIGAALAGGLGNAVFNILWITTLQSNVPSKVLSRVSAYEQIGINAGEPIGHFAGGGLATTVGVANVFWTCAAIQVVAAIVTVLLPQVSSIRTRDPEHRLDDSEATQGSPQ